MRRIVVAAALLLVAGPAVAQPGAGQAAPPPPGTIAGRVLIAPGVPAPRCQVSGQGASASCSKSGTFVVKQAPVEPIDLRIVVPGAGEVTLSAGAGEGQTTWLGDITVGMPGAVSGMVTAENSSDLDRTVIGIPELGVYTQPTVTGGYLLAGVPGGTWNLTLYPPGQAPIVRPVSITPGQVAVQADFQIKAAQPPATPR